MQPPTAPAELLAIDVAGDATLRVSLSTASGAAYARVTLSPAECAVLPHFNALWGHGRGCPGRIDVLRGVFDRCLDALGAQPPVVIVRPGDEAGFWLHVVGAAGPREIELGVLDAVALLLGDRARVAVEAAPRSAA